MFRLIMSWWRVEINVLKHELIETLLFKTWFWGLVLCIEYFLRPKIIILHRSDNPKGTYIYRHTRIITNTITYQDLFFALVIIVRPVEKLRWTGKSCFNRAVCLAKREQCMSYVHGLFLTKLNCVRFFWGELESIGS